MIHSIRIGYEDEHVLIGWKPHGLLTSGNSGKTFRSQIRKATGIPQIEPCHRLDFATAGWVVFGKHRESIQAINQSFQNGQIRKRYWTICHGTMPAKMLIQLPLDGKSSITHVHSMACGFLAQSDALTAALIETKTGRTHQIRRHLHAAGHGVVGDDKYPWSKGLYRGRGLFLCAHDLEFVHPITGEALRINSLPSKKFKSIPWIHKVLNERALPLSSSD
jgi:23S rRNA-/tRNA-specific pseudouridylate synthase